MGVVVFDGEVAVAGEGAVVVYGHDDLPAAEVLSLRKVKTVDAQVTWP